MSDNKEKCAGCKKMKLLVYGSKICAKCWIKRHGVPK